MKDFGEYNTLEDDEVQIAEEFLVRVASSCSAASPAKRFDELWALTWERTSSVLELEPTSHSIRMGHIKRWWFLFKTCSDLLTINYNHLKPIDHGWEDVEGELFARKELNLLPDEMCKVCRCKIRC